MGGGIDGWMCALLEPEWLGRLYLRGVRNYVTNGSKTALMDVIAFLYVSLGSSTVQLRNRLSSRRMCACSEAIFSSQNGSHAFGVYYRRSEFCYAFFLWAKWLTAKDIHKGMFSVCGGKCLSRKAVHTWVEKLSQGRSKVVDDARPGLPVEIVTEATVQWVEELIWGDRKIAIDSVATALGFSHG
jgi:hypothetical protein